METKYIKLFLNLFPNAWFVFCSCHNFLILVVIEIGCKGTTLKRNAQKNSLDKFDYQDYQKDQMPISLFFHDLRYLLLKLLHFLVSFFHGVTCLVEYACFSGRVARCIFYPCHEVLAVAVAIYDT